MALTGRQLERCHEVMDKLASRAISGLFAHPVDPVRDNCPDYFDRVAEPMDLGTVTRKLMSGQYRSVTEWKSDVNLIWSNSSSYNSRFSLIGLATKDLSDMFYRLTANFSDCPRTDWNDELQRLGNEMAAVMREVEGSFATQPSAPARRSPAAEDGNGFGRDEVLRLTRDIRAIRDEKKLSEITELLVQQEPEIEDLGDDLEIDISTLRTSTLNLLRRKVDQLLRAH
jgi:hypothetical protein